MEHNKLSRISDDPQEFYGKTDSAYIRVQYLPETTSFKFTVYNELFRNLQDGVEIENGMLALATIVRGMCEAAIQHTPNIFELGRQAERIDYNMMNTEGMPEDERELLLGEVKGNA